jgi:hypothetical protein
MLGRRQELNVTRTARLALAAALAATLAAGPARAHDQLVVDAGRGPTGGSVAIIGATDAVDNPIVIVRLQAAIRGSAKIGFDGRG